MAWKEDLARELEVALNVADAVRKIAARNSGSINFTDPEQVSGWVLQALVEKASLDAFEKAKAEPPIPPESPTKAFVGMKKKDIPSVLVKLGFKAVCEVGVFKGENFRNLLLSNPTEAVAVDLWKDVTIDISESQRNLNEMWEGMLRLATENPCVKVIRKASVEAARLFDQEHFDFVYIDANHAYEGVRADIEAWWPKVRKGGILAGHDYMAYTLYTDTQSIKFGVIEAVNEFAGKNGLVPVIDAETDWFIEKP